MTMTVLQAIERVLAEAKTPLSYREITDRILLAGLWHTDGKTPWATINAQLSVNIKTHEHESKFQRVGKGLFALRSLEQQDGPVAPPPVTPDEDIPATDSPTPFSFTDAAEWVMDTFGHKMPMHYRDIVALALEHGKIVTSGKTPEATLSAQIGSEITRQQQRGETPRFVRRGKGMIGLSKWSPSGVALQIDQHNTLMRQQLRDRLGSMSPADFEALVGRLLVALGFQNVQVTHYSGDGGIDVRGTLVVGDVIRTHMAVQVKRWKGNVQAPTVQQVRGSLGSHDQGLIITTSDFSAGAREEAALLNKTPIALMNGTQLVTLLVEHGIGVRRTAHELIDVIDQEEDE
jgi:restriction system protein